MGKILDGRLKKAVEDGNTRLTKTLLKSKADVNYVTKDNNPLILFPAITNNVHIIDLLIEAMANINAAGTGNNTALHFAAAKNHSGAIKRIILDQNIVINPLNDKGRTPLTLAVLRGHEEVAALIIKKYIELEVDVIIELDNIQDCEKMPLVNRLISLAKLLKGDKTIKQEKFESSESSKDDSAQLTGGFQIEETPKDDNIEYQSLTSEQKLEIFYLEKDLIIFPDQDSSSDLCGNI